MRIQWHLTHILICSSLATQRAVSQRFLSDYDFSTPSRGQEIRGKGTGDAGDDARAIPPAPSPTRRPSCRPNVSVSLTESPIVPRTESPTFLPTVSPLPDTEEPTIPYSPSTANEPGLSETGGPTPTTANIPASSPLPDAEPSTYWPFPESNDRPVESPSTAPMETVSPSAAPQQSPSIPCGDEILTALWGNLGLSLTPDEVFVNPSSYQCRALQRVVQQEGYQNFDAPKTIQYWVLYCIYFATNTPSSDSNNAESQVSTWEITSGWLETNVDPCDGWYGIGCDDSGRVNEIHLQRNGLTGTFPGEVSYLTLVGPRANGAGDLQVLELFNNGFLTNNIEDSWIQDLGNNLRVLNYGSTSFKGPVPSIPSGIEEFDCSYTLHSGAIPESVFDGLDSLRILIMDGNKFDSAVPYAIGALPNLEFFYIREAGIKGDLSYMEGMSSIVEHLVDRNPGLTGPVHTFIGGLRTLRSFSASDCGLTGTLPTELGELRGIVQLWLYGNRLSGFIPSEFAQMSQLRILALEDTAIRGEVPIDICLQRFSGSLTTMSADCDFEVDCTGFFPDCCTCCGRSSCGT